MTAINSIRLVAAVAFFFLAGGIGHAQLLEIREGQILTLKLDEPANTIAVGNTAIVDARIAFADTILLIGLRTGSTNIMAFDDAGEQIFSAAIAVVSAMDQQVITVIGGTRRQTFVCQRYRCMQAEQTAPIIDDRDRAFTQTTGEVHQ